MPCYLISGDRKPLLRYAEGVRVRVLAATPTMTVYKSLRKPANASAKMTVALIKGDRLPNPTTKVEGVDTMRFDPIVITKANMDVLVKEQFQPREPLGLQILAP